MVAYCKGLKLWCSPTQMLWDICELLSGRLCLWDHVNTLYLSLKKVHEAGWLKPFSTEVEKEGREWEEKNSFRPLGNATRGNQLFAFTDCNTWLCCKAEFLNFSHMSHVYMQNKQCCASLHSGSQSDTLAVSKTVCVTSDKSFQFYNRILTNSYSLKKKGERVWRTRIPERVLINLWSLF